MGYIIVSISFTLIGPATFLSPDPSVTLIIISAGIAGLGFAMNVVSSFVRVNMAVSKDGFQNDMETCLIISSNLIFLDFNFVVDIVVPLIHYILIHTRQRSSMIHSENLVYCHCCQDSSSQILSPLYVDIILIFC